MKSKAIDNVSFMKRLQACVYTKEKITETMICLIGAWCIILTQSISFFLHFFVGCAVYGTAMNLNEEIMINLLSIDGVIDGNELIQLRILSAPTALLLRLQNKWRYGGWPKLLWRHMRIDRDLDFRGSCNTVTRPWRLFSAPCRR